MGVFPSGQRGQTVNLLAVPTVVRIHPLPPNRKLRLAVFCFADIHVPERSGTAKLVYKSFRYLHMMRPGGSEEAFPVSADLFSEQCDSYLKRCEADLRRFIAHSEEELPNMQPIAMDQLQQEYPKYAPSMLSLLHAVSDKLDN